MRQKRRHYALGLLTSLTIAASLLMNPTVHATQAEGTTELTTVDMSKGVEYIYDTEGTATGINLNGNSVIIKESVNSTVETSLINFYIDTNKNGVIDAGETMETVGNGIDVSSELSIYGVFQQKSTEKIVVTVESGDIAFLYGVLQGEISTTDSSAIVINVNSDDVTCEVMAAYQSTVKSTAANATLIDINATAGSFVQLIGGMESNLDAGANSNVVLDIDLTNDAMITGQFIAAQGSNVSPSNIVGNMNVNMNPTAIPSGYTTNFNSGFGLKNCVLDGSFELNCKKVRVGTFTGLENAWVKGNYTFDVDETSDILSSFYGMVASTVDGNAEIGWVGNASGMNNNAQIRGISSYYSNKDYVVGGDCTLTYRKGYASKIEMIKSYSSINGNVKMEVVDGIIGDLEGLYNVTVAEGKNTTFTMGKNISENNSNETNKVVVNGTIYAVYYSNLGGDCSTYIYNNNTTDSYASCSAIYDTDIAGNTTVVVNGGYYSSLTGLGSSTVVEGDAQITFSNINSGVNVNNLSYGTNNGAYYSTIKGNIDIDVDDLNLYAFYGVQSTTCNGKITGSYNNVTVYNNLYGASISSDCAGVDITMTDVNAGSVIYGIYASYVTCNGDMICNISNAATSSYLYGMNGSSLKVVGDVTCDITNSRSSSMAYGVSGVNVQGALTVNVTENGEDAGDEDTYYGLYGASSANATGAITIAIDGITTTNPLYPYYSGGASDNGDVNITVSSLTHTTTAPIGNSTSQGQNLTMTIDSNSSILAGTTITPGSSTGGECKATYKGTAYYSGQVIFDNITEDTIYLNSGSYQIPEGVTVKANTAIYLKNSSNVLVEGTLDGDLAEKAGYIYINGGNITADISSYSSVYYPLETTFTSGKGTVTTTSTNTHALCSSKKFAKKGSTVNYTVKPSTGYYVKEAKVVKEGNESIEVTNSSTTYSFIMPNEPVTFDVVFDGKELVLGKSVMDPVVKIGQTYDATSPIYDLSTVLICNDATSGTVSYEVDDTAELPEGLYLEGSLICGAIAEGTEEKEQVVKILVTGKNGNTATLSLNFVLTNGEGTQTSQDGRIVVDNENKVVYLCGNSVVLESHTDGTAIFLDDNRDGIADFAEAAETGDFSTYTVYGVYGVDVKNPVKITVNGGSVGQLYGAYGNNIACSGTSLDVQFNGGTVGKFYALSSARAYGTMKVVIGNDATVTTASVSSDASGYYYDKQGAVTINGQYSVKDEINATSVTTSTSSVVSFAKPVTVTGNITLGSASSSYTSTVSFGSSATVSANALTVNKDTTATFNGEVNAATIVLNAPKARLTTFAKAVKATTSITTATNAKVDFRSTVNTATLTTGSSSTTSFSGVVTVPTISLGASSTTTFNGEVVSTSNITVAATATATFNEVVSAYNLKQSATTSKTTFNKNVTVGNSLDIVGEVWINEGVTVTAKTLYKRTNSKTYLKGALLPQIIDSSYRNGYVFMMDGSSLSELTSGYWTKLYYPVTTKTDLNGTTITIENSQTVGNVVYLCAGNSYIPAATAVEGYESSFKVDGVDMTSGYFSMPQGKCTVEAVYTPTQISLSKSFAEPTGSVGATYTEEQPLYDLKNVTISNDTTDAYGSDVVYAVNEESSLPKGLSLENGKVIGTPEVENETGDIVKFDITGRNGTTATVEVLITILAEGYEPVDINNTVSVSGIIIDLQGTSVVIYPDVADSSKVSIYPDYNADGKPDNNIPLKISGSNSYDLSSYYIYGYKNLETPYNGNINITMLAGKVKAIYGVRGEYDYSTEETTYSTVNGKVSIDIQGGTVSSYAYGAQYAKVDNVELKVTDGTHNYADFYGVYKSEIENDVDFTCGGTATIKEGGTSQSVTIEAAYNSKIGGDVNLIVGFESDSYGFTSTGSNSYYSIFRGVYETTVAGNVNATIDGYWAPKKDNYFVSGGSVGKNVNINWKNGTMGVESRSIDTCFAYSATIKGNMNVTVADGAVISNSYDTYALYNSTAQNASVYVPTTANRMISNFNLIGGSRAKVENYAYSYNRGYVQISGEYTIAEDMSIASLYILEDANVTIAEGTKVNVNLHETRVHEGATFINKGELKVAKAMIVTGTFDNYGTFQNTYLITLNEGSKVINHEDATWTVGAGITNNSVIYNYGTFNQTYNDVSLGNIYTTKDVVLYGAENNYITDTNLYYPYVVEYPEQCVGSVEFACADTSTSAMDNKEYVKAGSTFTVTPGTKLIDTVSLASVTYGTDGSATEQQDGTWQGTVPFEPFTVVLNYTAAEDISKITISPSEDSIDNSSEDRLIVNKEYTLENPLYDLTTIAVENDTVETGNIIYSVDSNSSLPNGLVLKDGKLYGTLKEATDSEQTIDFIIKGRNQTSAVFTLTLAEVKKCIPEWSVPDNDFCAIINQTLANVELPTSDYGTYSWKDASASVGSVATTLEDVELLFTPNDVNNYDWDTAAEKVGATYKAGVVTCKVPVKVSSGTPTYVAPTNLYATYGQTFGDIEIPSGNNDGVFTWEYEDSRKVGNAGQHTYYMTYTPNDENYQTVKGIEVTLTVKKAVPVLQKLETLSSDCQVPLKNITLPATNNGTYQWITTADVIPVSGKSYQLGFTPNDVTNYDWTALDEWSDIWNCVVIPVKIALSHNLPEDWSNDDTHHWKECNKNDCTEIVKGEHTWNAGEVEQEATETAAGSKKYTCTVCSATKTETIPATGHVKHTYGEEWKTDEDNHWHECTAEGCEETTAPEAHTWDEGVVETEATETTTGSKKYTCTVCNATKTETIPATGHVKHTYGEEWKSDEDKHWQECTAEGCKETTTPEAHTWDEGVVETEATETTTGSKKYTCTVCKATKTEAIPATGHVKHTYGEEWKSDEDKHWQECTAEGCEETTTPENHTWDEGVVETEATETTTGSKKYSCTVCKATKMEEIPVTDHVEHTTHTFKTTWCYDDDEHWHECEDSDCDEVSATEKHQYGEAEIIVAATEDDEGTKKYTCTTCGYSYTEQYDLAQDETQEPLEEDEEFEDEENKITYVVTSTTNAEIEFVEFGNETATELVIPDTVTYGGITYKITSIAPNAFKNHRTLKKIVIGPNILAIGKNAFYGCKKLSSVTISANVVTIGDSAFQNCIALKKITIPSKVSTIGKNAFYGCKKLSTIKMGKGIENIGNSAFQNCIALKKIEIPSKVKKIGSKAFYGCKKLTNITIKTTKLNTSKVGKQAFTKAGSSNYKKLTVKVPKKKLKAYKTMLKKRGLSSKAKVKK